MDVAERPLQGLASGIRNGCGRGTIARPSLRTHEFKGILVEASQQVWYTKVTVTEKVLNVAR